MGKIVGVSPYFGGLLDILGFSDYVSLNVTKTDEWWTGKDLEGGRHGVMRSNGAHVWRNWEKSGNMYWEWTNFRPTFEENTITTA